MKKWILFVSLWGIISSPLAWAGHYQEYYDLPKGENAAQVMGRGVLNLGSFPIELASTFRREKEDHSKLWPATYFPKLFTNVAYRLSSGLHDTLFFPWYASFVSDTQSWAEKFGLPRYPWNKE